MPDAPDDAVLDVVVEIPRGSRNKYEYDEGSGVLRLDRRLTGALAFPADYGYVPGTRGRDGDAIDALVLVDEPTFPGVHVHARVVAGVRLVFDEEDGSESTEVKLVTVAVSDPSHDGVTDLQDLPSHQVDEIEHFFSMYTQLGAGPSPSRTEQLDVDEAMGSVRDAWARVRQDGGS